MQEFLIKHGEDIKAFIGWLAVVSFLAGGTIVGFTELPLPIKQIGAVALVAGAIVMTAIGLPMKKLA